MPKKIKFPKENRGHGGRDREEGGGGWKGPKGRGRPDFHGNPNEGRQTSQGDYQQPGGQQDSGQPGSLADYRKILQERREKPGGGFFPVQGRPARKGCFPKIFMLALPFALLIGWFVLGF